MKKLQTSPGTTIPMALFYFLSSTEPTTCGTLTSVLVFITPPERKLHKGRKVGLLYFQIALRMENHTKH
jgi:hypothetical protein